MRRFVVVKQQHIGARHDSRSPSRADAAPHRQDRVGRTARARGGRPVAGTPRPQRRPCSGYGRLHRAGCAAPSPGDAGAARAGPGAAPSRSERSHPRPTGALDVVRCPCGTDPLGGPHGGDSRAGQPRPCGSAGSPERDPRPGPAPGAGHRWDLPEGKRPLSPPDPQRGRQGQSQGPRPAELLQPGVVAFLYSRRWEEEKCFDTWKNDFTQAKAAPCVVPTPPGAPIPAVPAAPAF